MILLVDIGGTHTRISTTIDDQTFSPPIKYKSPPDYQDMVSKLTTECQTLAQGESLSRVLIGLPGTSSDDQSKIFTPPHLQGWNDQPLKQDMTNALSAEVDIINDADLAGLGEAVHGAGQNHNIVAYLTISTGIGGTRIVNQRIDKFARGFEPGQQIIDGAGSLCEDCDAPTTLEQLIGGASVERRYKMPPKEIDDPKVWQQIALWLAYGLNNVTVFWSPDIIVLGGPMMNDIDIAEVKQNLTKILVFARKIPALVPAALDDDRAFHGMLAFLKSF